ncbi:MAG: radical SAM protein [Deltaproteobacteria bacterium]|nr:radical SAM protein [Deltaproteobacteria bacterium]
MEENIQTTPMRGRVTIIQLEITYRCNLRCDRCNRHCHLDFLPYHKDADMTEYQLDKFIHQVKVNNVHLHQIRMLGGEPLLHPQADTFLSKLYYELMAEDRLDTIVIVTNGIIFRHERFKNVMNDPEISPLFESGRIRFQVAWPGKEDTFRGVFIAPVDMGMHWKECYVPRACGSLLNTYGYWPNGNCAAIARLLYLPHYARYEYPLIFEENWPTLESDLCRYCVKGNSALNYNRSSATTESYRKAMEKWKNGFEGRFDRF